MATARFRVICVYLHKERAKDTNRLAMGSNIGPLTALKLMMKMRLALPEMSHKFLWIDTTSRLSLRCKDKQTNLSGISYAAN